MLPVLFTCATAAQKLPQLLKFSRLLSQTQEEHLFLQSDLYTIDSLYTIHSYIRY